MQEHKTEEASNGSNDTFYRIWELLAERYKYSDLLWASLLVWHNNTNPGNYAYSYHRLGEMIGINERQAIRRTNRVVERELVVKSRRPRLPNFFDWNPDLEFGTTFTDVLQSEILGLGQVKAGLVAYVRRFQGFFWPCASKAGALTKDGRCPTVAPEDYSVDGAAFTPDAGRGKQIKGPAKALGLDRGTVRIALKELLNEGVFVDALVSEGLTVGDGTPVYAFPFDVWWVRSVMTYFEVMENDTVGDGK
jgi:hypothetical protein